MVMGTPGFPFTVALSALLPGEPTEGRFGVVSLWSHRPERVSCAMLATLGNAQTLYVLVILIEQTL